MMSRVFKYDLSQRSDEHRITLPCQHRVLSVGRQAGRIVVHVFSRHLVETNKT